MEKKVINRIVESIFFSNFFLILLSLALNIETTIKIGLPLNSVVYYTFISTLTVLFYLYAYRIPGNLKIAANPRTRFYIHHRYSIRIFTYLLMLICSVAGVFLGIKCLPNIDILSWKWIMVFIFTGFLTFGYYDFKLGISLRKTIWLKPFLIGWTWAITTVFLPILFLMLEHKHIYHLDVKFYFLLS